MQTAHQRTPSDHGEEAVGDRVGVEAQRRERRGAGSDRDVFDSGEQEIRPEQVRKLRGREKRSERDARLHALGRERHGEVADEHGAANLLSADGRAQMETA
jgi:hypothetical protein